MKRWKTLKKEWLRDKKIAEEYGKLKPYFQLVSKLIEARLKKGLTQEEVAKRMQTKQSAIARLESGNANPTIAFLERYIEATGFKLIIQVK